MVVQRNRGTVRSLLLVLLVCCAHASMGAPAPVAADDGDAEEGRFAPLRGLAAYGVRDLSLRLAGAPGSTRRRQAIDDGVAWLAAHQAPTGSWQAAGFQNWCDGQPVKDAKAKPDGQGLDIYDVGITGLAICAFHAAGHSHLHGGRYADAVARGLKYLASVQDREGCLGERTTRHFLYNHAYGSQALLEAYAITGDERLRPVCQRAIDFMRHSRNKQYGWRYGVKPEDTDTSLTSALSMALLTALHMNEAAIRHGAPPPLEIDPAMLAGASAWFKQVVDPRTGRAGYQERGTMTARNIESINTFPGDRSEAMTAAVLAVRLFMPARLVHDADWEAVNERSTRLLLAIPPQWNTKTGHIDLYYWYYGTVALEKLGGAHFKLWDTALERELTGAQRTDTNVCQYKGSWDPADPWSADGGRVYSTAIATISLAARGRLTPAPPEPGAIQALLQEPLAPERAAWLLDVAAFHRMESLAPRAVDLLGHAAPAVRQAAARVAFMGDLRRIAEPALLGHLDNPNTEVRLAVLAALQGGGHLSPAIAQRVGTLLDHDDATIRRAAAGALSAARELPEELAPALLARLKDSDGRLRMRVASALVRMGKTEQALPVIQDGLDSRAAMVQAEAARATARLASLPAVLLAPTRKAAQSSAPVIRIPAALALYRGSPEDRSPQLAAHLLTGLAAADASLRRDLLDALTSVDPTHAQAHWKSLPPFLVRGSERDRLAALHAIRHLAPNDESLPYLFLGMASPSPIVSDAARAAVDARPESRAKLALLLAPSLRATDPQLRAAAWQGLAHLGEDGVSVLADHLRHKEAPTVVQALRVAQSLGPTARVLSSEVMRLMRESKSPTVIEAAMATLVRISPCDRTTVEALIAIARAHGSLRDGAMAALAVLAEDRTGRIAKEALHAIAEKEADKALRVAAIQQLDASERSVAKMLFEFLSSPTSEVVSAAVERLGAVGTPVVRPALRILKGKDTQRYAGAMRILQMVGPEASRAVRTLLKFYENPHDPNRWAAADALVAIGEDAVRPLLDYAKKADEQNQIWTIALFGRIGPNAARATAWLEKARDAGSPKLAEAAQQALARIQAHD